MSASNLQGKAGTMKLIVEFQVGLIKAAFGNYSEQWFNAWRNLHCRTNGHVTDLVASIIRLLRSKPTFEPAAGVLGSVDKPKLDEILGSLHRDGLYRSSTRLDRGSILSLVDLAMKTPSCPFPAVPGQPEECVFSREKPIAPTYWHKWETLIADETVQKIACDPTLIAVAAQYLRVDPVLVSVALWHSIPFSSQPSAEGAQIYHFDLAFPSWLNVFFYLTDVGADNGPHCFVKGTHKRDQRGRHLRNRGIVRIPDADVEAAYGRAPIEEIRGAAGTFFVANTRAWHKGKMPVQGERLMFELVFASSQITRQFPPRFFSPKDPEAIAAIEAKYPRYFELFRPNR
jgi:Phytanoyl-CoA dioxygenase (PhyH)